MSVAPPGRRRRPGALCARQLSDDDEPESMNAVSSSKGKLLVRASTLGGATAASVLFKDRREGRRARRGEDERPYEAGVVQVHDDEREEVPLRQGVWTRARARARGWTASGPFQGGEGRGRRALEPVTRESRNRDGTQQGVTNEDEEGEREGGGRLHGRRLVREGRLLAHVVQVEDAGRRARPGRCLRQDVRVDRGDCERAKKSQRAWSERRRRAEEEVERDDDDAQLAGSIPMPAASCRAVCTSSGGGAYDIWPGERAWNDWLCCMARLA